MSMLVRALIGIAVLSAGSNSPSAAEAAEWNWVLGQTQTRGWGLQQGTCQLESVSANVNCNLVAHDGSVLGNFKGTLHRGKIIGRVQIAASDSHVESLRGSLVVDSTSGYKIQSMVLTNSWAFLALTLTQPRR